MAGFIPLLSLGIPTTPALAILLSTLMINGLTPGPMLFQQQALLVWTVIGSMLIANTALLILNLPLVGLWARISRVPYHVLGPIVLAVSLAAAWAGFRNLTSRAPERQPDAKPPGRSMNRRKLIPPGPGATVHVSISEPSIDAVKTTGGSPAALSRGTRVCGVRRRRTRPTRPGPPARFARAARACGLPGWLPGRRTRDPSPGRTGSPTLYSPLRVLSSRVPDEHELQVFPLGVGSAS